MGAGQPEPLPFRRILVTGADGFVGRHLVPALAARLAPDARLTLASRRGGDEPGRIALDLTDADSVHAAIENVRPDLVVHLAAQASVGQSLGAAADTWGINVCGSLTLARAIGDAVPDCTVFFASTSEVYGLAFNDGRVTEATLPRPQGPYARSKAAAEAMFADVLPDTARLIVARPTNHSGPGQDERFVIPAFAAQIARIEAGAPPEIRVGNLDAERDFLDVRDVVAAYMALLAAAPALPARNLFNIASGRTVRIGEILDRLRALSPIEMVAMPDHVRMRPSEVPRTLIDSGALHAATGWSPRHDLDAMLKNVLTADRPHRSA